MHFFRALAEDGARSRGGDAEGGAEARHRERVVGGGGFERGETSREGGSGARRGRGGARHDPNEIFSRATFSSRRHIRGR